MIRRGRRHGRWATMGAVIIPQILQIHSGGVHDPMDLCGGIMGSFPPDSFQML